MSACEVIRKFQRSVPNIKREMFVLSNRSSRIILPSFSLRTIRNISFIFNPAKIINFLLDHDIKYNVLTNEQFKKILKIHLIAIRMKSIKRDDSWLPCNQNIFSL